MRVLSMLMIPFFTLTVLLSSGLAPTSVSAAYNVEIQGHRGARSLRPENTLGGFQYALEVGVDTLELDLGTTKDGVLVISHDPYINPGLCLDKNKKKLKTKLALRDLYYRQIKEFDCGSLKHPGFPQQKLIGSQAIPRLRDLFEIVKNSKLDSAKKVQFNIETKIFPGKPGLTLSPEIFTRKLIELVKEYNFQKRVVIQSFDHRSLKWAKKLAPKIRIAALISDNLPDLVALAKNLKAEIISPYYPWINQDVVIELHKIGVKVIPWTVNKPKDWQMLLNWKVDGIITDNPAALMDYLKTAKY